MTYPNSQRLPATLPPPLPPIAFAPPTPAPPFQPPLEAPRQAEVAPITEVPPIECLGVVLNRTPLAHLVSALIELSDSAWKIPGGTQAYAILSPGTPGARVVAVDPESSTAQALRTLATGAGENLWDDIEPNVIVSDNRLCAHVQRNSAHPEQLREVRIGRVSVEGRTVCLMFWCLPHDSSGIRSLTRTDHQRILDVVIRAVISDKFSAIRNNESLTGPRRSMVNRAGFDWALDHVDPESDAIVFIDVERLRRPRAGVIEVIDERVLTVVAHRISMMVGDGDLVCRMDRSTFAVILTNVSLDGAVNTGDLIRGAIAEGMPVDVPATRLSATLAVVADPTFLGSAGVAQAGMRTLRVAKNGGGNRVVLMKVWPR